MTDRLFKHSGDLGDILYALPTIRAMGGGTLAIAAASFTRHLLVPERWAPLAPLLKAQPYIQDVIEFTGQPEAIDLDAARHYRREAEKVGSKGRLNLADYHLLMFGHESKERDRAWLQVPEKPPLHLPAWHKVIFSRTPRYRNRKFPWGAIWERYHHAAIFVGTPGEHHEFESTVGKVPYVATRDFLELAQLIAACKLFVGNQSAPYAVAEGLKVRTVQETDPAHLDCLFEREGAVYGLDDLVIDRLPEVV